MKKLLTILIMAVLALSVLVSCKKSQNVENEIKSEEAIIIDDKKDINDYVTIKEAVNKEVSLENDENVKYIYEVPIINIDRPGAQKINNMFLDLEKAEEERIGKYQSSLLIKSKAYLYDNIISVVMEIKKTGPFGIYVINYDIENDKEISTKELFEKYKFEPEKLIKKINQQVEINESKPEEEQEFISIDYFVDTVITANSNNYFSDDDFKKMEEMQNKTQEEKEKFVVENISELKVYINNDGDFVFVHRGTLADEELIVDNKQQENIDENN